MAESFHRDRDYIVPLLIDGQDYKVPNNHPTCEVYRCALLERAWHTHLATPATTTIAIDAAAKAFKSWSKTSIDERKAILYKAADLLEERKDAAHYYQMVEMGSTEVWSAMNMSLTTRHFRSCADILEEVVQPEEGHGNDKLHSIINKVPYGVVLGIAPWNASLFLGLRSILAPIAAGNTVVMLSSAKTPMTHYFLAKVFHDAGLPAGVLNVLPNTVDPKEAAEVVETCVKSHHVRKVNFTGSSAVGWKISETAGRYGKPTLMELGGKGICIALADADLDLYAKELVNGAYDNSGQVCMSTDIGLIPAGTQGSLLPKIRAEIERQWPAKMPIVSHTYLKKHHHLVTDAVSKGAKIVIGEVPDTSKPESVMTPMVLSGITKDMELYDTESFGAMFYLVEYDGNNVDEALEFTRDITYGLSVAVFSKDVEKAKKVCMEIDSGAVHVNHATTYDNPALPHGGVKDSGFGRFGGKWGLNEFLVIKTLTWPKEN